MRGGGRFGGLFCHSTLPLRAPKKPSVNRVNRFEVNVSPKKMTGYYQCVKSVRIRSYSGPYFLSFGLNTERYSVRDGVSLRIQFKYGKIRTRITPNTSTLSTVSKMRIHYFKQIKQIIKQLCN